MVRDRTKESEEKKFKRGGIFKRGKTIDFNFKKTDKKKPIIN